jgi:peptidoglycan/xylan/chitin deacetylase (PgdA/CDA1 family)
MMRAILTFHSIEASRSVLSFDPQLFDALLATLAEKAIPICDLDTLLASDEMEGVAITFDDGMKSVYLNALPLLIAHRAPAHIFLTTGAIGEDPGRKQPGKFSSFEMLNWRDVEALHKAGIRVESHTHTHPDMRSLTKDQIAEECGIADEIIASRLGRSPGYFAYPFGYHNQAARDCVRGRYSGCVTTELRPLGVDEDKAALPRLDSYYFRSSVLIRSMDSNLMRGYLRLRSHMRTLRGSQCPPADR